MLTGVLVALVTPAPATPSSRSSVLPVGPTLGIGSVFVGIVDPDPRNNGLGLRLLADAGVYVEVGILEDEIREFLTPHLAGTRTD